MVDLYQFHSVHAHFVFKHFLLPKTHKYPRHSKFPQARMAAWNDDIPAQPPAFSCRPKKQGRRQHGAARKNRHSASKILLYLTESLADIFTSKHLLERKHKYNRNMPGDGFSPCNLFKFSCAGRPIEYGDEAADDHNQD